MTQSETSPLPAEAVPFLRSFLLALLRRLPALLGPPPRPTSLADPDGCQTAARDLLTWLEALSREAGRGVGAAQESVAALRGTAERAHLRFRRESIRARHRGGEDTASGQGAIEILEELAERLETGSAAPVVRALDELRRRRHEADRESREAATRLGELGDEVRRIAEGIAALEARLRELEGRSMRDALTGLWNAAALEERLVEEVSRARRYTLPLAVLVWEVDALGEVNRRAGHRTGDHVLQAVAGRAVRTLRRGDFLARRGGTAFAALLPNTGIERARTTAARLRHAMTSAPVDAPSGPATVIVRAGSAALEPGESPAAFLARAEEGLAGTVRGTEETGPAA